MSDPSLTEHRSLDTLADAIFARGWVFEIITLGAAYQPPPLTRMIAHGYIGRIMTPDGEVEWSAVTPRMALAGAYAEAIRIHGHR